MTPPARDQGKSADFGDHLSQSISIDAASHYTDTIPISPFPCISGVDRGKNYVCRLCKGSFGCRVPKVQVSRIPFASLSAPPRVQRKATDFTGFTMLLYRGNRDPIFQTCKHHRKRQTPILFLYLH